MFNIKGSAKAYVAAIVAALGTGLAATQAALADNVVTTAEGVGIAAAVVGALAVAFGVTYATPNVSKDS